MMIVFWFRAPLVLKPWDLKSGRRIKKQTYHLLNEKVKDNKKIFEQGEKKVEIVEK